MALARTYAMALAGVRGHVVEVEADIENGLVALLLVGLPDTALREARDRIRSAIINSRHTWPQRRITVGLSPASLPKRGSGFDAAIAVAILSADGSVPKECLAGTVFLGELGLDGRLRPVPGVLPCTAAAAAAGFERAVVPVENAAEATLVPGMQIVAAPSLGAVIDWLHGGSTTAVDPPVQVLDSGTGLTPDAALRVPVTGRDLADVVGQPVARRAAEICAAGGHHMLLLGPPGVGKTMLAVGLGHAAVAAGYRTYYTTAADLVARCHKAAIEGRWATTMRFFAGPRLLIIDEVGYLPMQAEGAAALFQVITQRYLKGSIALTTNLGIPSWGKIFDDPMVAAAMLDRLLHRSAVLNITGESYRMRAHRARAGKLIRGDGTP
jgi:hypothetical protein